MLNTSIVVKAVVILYRRNQKMQFIRHTGVYILLLIFIITSNGFMLIENRCTCNEKSTSSCSAMNCPNGEMQMKDCCQCNASASCCAEKKEFPQKENCKCSSLFYKIPVFYDSMQKTNFSIFSGYLYSSNISDNILSDYSFHHSPKLTKPPGNIGRSSICMISSLLL